MALTIVCPDPDFTVYKDHEVREKLKHRYKQKDIGYFRGFLKVEQAFGHSPAIAELEKAIFKLENE